MHRIEHVAPHGWPRLVADRKLARADFTRIAREIDQRPFRARKIGLVAARRATAAEKVVTRWNGAETVATAEPGDWIATNMDAEARPLRDGQGALNVYVIEAGRFPELYQPVDIASEHGEVYRSRVTVEAIELAGGFEILAPWNETQRAAAGYLLDNGHEIFGNAKETFEATYERI